MEKEAEFVKLVQRNESYANSMSVNKIIVFSPDKSSVHRRIDIHYKLIGEIDLSPEYIRYIKTTA